MQVTTTAQLDHAGGTLTITNELSLSHAAIPLKCFRILVRRQTIIHVLVLLATLEHNQDARRLRTIHKVTNDVVALGKRDFVQFFTQFLCVRVYVCVRVGEWVYGWEDACHA